MDEGRLPTSLYVDAVLKQCEIDFIPYYVLQKGEHASGVILAKLNALDGTAALRMQQRDFMTGQLGWTDALSEDKVEEAKADNEQASVEPKVEEESGFSIKSLIPSIGKDD